MASTFNLSNLTANLIATQLNTSTTYGFATAILTVYSGTQPANANTALAGNTALATFTLPAAVSNTVVNNVITFGAITSVTASNSATATFFRITSSSGGNVVCDGSVGVTGCDLNLNSVAISSGANVSVTSFTYTVTE